MNKSELSKQKTVFVLVHTSDMLIPSGLDISLESKKSFPTNPLIYNKTLWSAVCESVLEYIRIIYDIFGTEREMALIIVDSKEKICISTNDKGQQTWRSWMKVLSEIGSPSNATPSLLPSVLPGFNSIRSVLELKSENDYPNIGRVIVLGYKMGENVAQWVDDVSTAMNSETLLGTSKLVAESEWYFIDVEPVVDGVQGNETPTLVTTEKSSQHKLFRQTVMANRELHRSLMSLCEQQHDLACILVQNIPMKEDTNNTQSAMYGVELIHPRAALDHIVQAGLLPLMTMAHRPYCGFSSCIGIRWVTPKQTQDIDYYNTKSVYRITTADVCHRASCCLANFVLEGRSVVLEIDHSLIPIGGPGLPEPKYELLLLTSHSTLLHVHTLSAHRDPIFPAADSQINNKMPLISELANKKLSSKLRTADFSQFILSNRLVPAAPQSSFLPMERAVREIEQHTRYWPELTTDTLVFNKPLMPKIAEILSKKHLDFSEKSNCIGFLQQMIFDQSNAEKTAKKAGSQDSKAFKTELELVLFLHQDRSPAHKEILDSFEVFGSSLKGVVDIGAVLLAADESHASINVGLSKLDKMLKDGGMQLKALTHPVDKPAGLANVNKTSSNSLKSNHFTSRKQQRRPEQSTLSLREILSLASDNASFPKRKKFDGELCAVDNITELYPPSLPPSFSVDPRKE